MNYACVIFGGLTFIVTVIWFVVARKSYVGPTSSGGINTEIERVRKVSVARRTSV
jgi:hypothetical protein